MNQPIPVTIVNHVAIEIAAPPDAVWRAIQEEYLEAKKFREAGTLQPLDDEPGAVLGGYRMRMMHGEVVDDRIVRFTEIDHAARRLSAHADYLTVPAGGMGVWVTYHAQALPDGGTRYAIDSHARLQIEPSPDIAAAIASMKLSFDASLLAYLEKVKASLEGAA